MKIRQMVQSPLVSHRRTQGWTDGHTALIFLARKQRLKSSECRRNTTCVGTQFIFTVDFTSYRMRQCYVANISHYISTEITNFCFTCFMHHFRISSILIQLYLCISHYNMHLTQLDISAITAIRRSLHKCQTAVRLL